MCTIDVRFDIKTTVNGVDKTMMYYFTLYDRIIQYTPLSGIVKKLFILVM